MWQPDYITANELKHALGIEKEKNDAEIAFAIAAASRAIDDFTGRQFGKLDTASPRYYRGFYDGNAGHYAVIIDDLMTTTDLVIAHNREYLGAYSETLVIDTDFILGPLNAPADGKPWTYIQGLNFPTRDNAIRITAKWGWTAVPSQVKQACLIQAARFFKRKDAPFGIQEFPDAGGMRLLDRLDPDVQLLLNGLIRYWGAVSI